MKLKDLAPNPKNPRTITKAKLEMLTKSLATHGDLSGIVYNKKSKQLVGGHQRKDISDPETDIVITKRLKKPTKTGTIAEGYVLIDGEKYSYREVWWDAKQEKAANIAANKGAGEWDMPQLAEWMKELSDFDADFDVDLTMFDSSERKKFVDMFETASESEQGKLDQKKFVFIKCPHCKKVFEEGRFSVVEN